MTPKTSPPTDTVITFRPPDLRAVCRGIVFAMPASDAPATAVEFLKLLDGRKAKSRVPEEAEWELRSRIEKLAPQLALPGAALVIETASDKDEICRDLLSVMTVLSKSSRRVYLREKEPILSNIRWGKKLVVLVPRGSGSDGMY